MYISTDEIFVIKIIDNYNVLHKYTYASIYLFFSRMKAAIDELAPGNGIEMKEAKDGSGRGAAIVAAVACRLAA